MRNVLTGILIFIGFTVFAQKGTTISFTNFSAQDGSFILYKDLVGARSSIDTFLVDKKDSFIYHLKDSQNLFYILKNEKIDFVLRFIADSSVQLVKETGSKSISSHCSFETSILNHFFIRSDYWRGRLAEAALAIERVNDVGNPGASIREKQIYTSINDSIRDEQVALFYENFDKIASLYLLSGFLKNESLKNLQSAFFAIDPIIKKLNLYTILEKKYFDRIRNESNVFLPEIELTIYDTDERFEFKSRKSELILIDFWGTWCKPCLEDIPHLRKLQQKYSDKSFEILGIASEFNNDPLNFRKVLKDLNVIWPTVMTNFDEKENNLPKLLDINIFPTYLFVDRNTRVLLRANKLKEIENFLSSYFGFFN